MITINIYDSTNQIILSMNEDKITGKINAFNKVHIIDKQDNFYEGLFIDDILEGIDYNKVGLHGGVKQFSVFSKEGDYLFLLDENKITTSLENAVKAELVIHLNDEREDIKHFCYFNRGKIKLVDFVKDKSIS